MVYQDYIPLRTRPGEEGRVGVGGACIKARVIEVLCTALPLTLMNQEGVRSVNE